MRKTSKIPAINHNYTARTLATPMLKQVTVKWESE